MKLWQKVFLCTLAFVMLGLVAASALILSVNHSASIERAERQAVANHQYLSAGIFNKVLYERFQEGKILLTDREIQSLLSEAEPEEFQAVSGFCIYRDGQILFCSQWDMQGEMETFRNMIRDKDHIWCSIRDTEKGEQILAASTETLEGWQYEFYSLTDVTDLYEMFDEQLGMIQMISISISIILAGILLLIAWYFLRPLKTINSALRTISAGDYHQRLKQKGSLEFRELSENVNVMAASVEENVEKIRQIAEGRKRFIDSFAHEMKTPLTSILGFADILRLKKDMPERERQEYAGIIVEETKRLQTLSGKLLQLSLADHAVLELVPVYLPELFETISQFVTLTLEKKGIRFSVDSVPAWIKVDRELFTSLILNLIDNAAKASKNGETIALSCVRDQGWLHITVADEGIGMTQQELSHAIEPFYMADKSRSRKNGGVGLGLSLCAEIVKCHQMQFQIESAPNVGTKIHLLVREYQKEEKQE